MELTAAVAIIVAAIAPFIVALLTHPGMADPLKRLIAGGVAVALGIIVAIATGRISGVPADWISGLTWILASTAIVISLAQGFYGAWKPAVKRFEAATSVQPVVVPPAYVEGTEGLDA